MVEEVKDSSNKDQEMKAGIWNLLLNIAIPMFILIKMSGPDRLGPFWGLIVALSFPTMYSLYEFISHKKLNVFSGIGFGSILLTGGFALMKLDAFWFAVKEAAIPGFFAILVLASIKTKYSPIKMFLYNPQIFNVDKIEGILKEKGEMSAFNKIIQNTTLILSFSFILSSILNFGLARYILKSPPETPEFNAELGKMTGLSFPVIMVPCLIVTLAALWYLHSGIKKLTGLDSEEILAIKE